MDVCAAITLLTFTRSVSDRGRLFPESLIFTLRPHKTVSHDCSTFMIKYQRSHWDLCSAGGKTRGLFFLLYLHDSAEQINVKVCIFSCGKVGCFLLFVPTADFSGGTADGSDQSHKDALQERLFFFFFFIFKAQFLLHSGGGGA